MNKTVKNILVTLLLVVLSPVTFACCPCLVKSGTAENSVTCCCKKKAAPAERKCPSQKQLIRLQALEKQRMQDPAPPPAPRVVSVPAETVQPEASCRFDTMTPPAAGKGAPEIPQPPSLFLQYCSFII